MEFDPLRRALLAGGITISSAAVVDRLLNVLGTTEEDTEAVPPANVSATVASPSSFPTIDPTGQTNSAPGLQEAFNSAPDGGTVFIPPGRYLLDGYLTIYGGKSLRVSAFGATFVQDSANPAFTLLGSYESILGVTVVTRQLVAFGGGEVEIDRLDLDSAPDWRVGDILKIVADDGIPEGRPESGGNRSRVGEFAIVDRVEASTVWLAHKLRDNYETNIRVTRLTQQTLHWSGGTFEVAESRVGMALGPMLNLANLYAPIVDDVSIRSSAGVGVQVVSCFGYELRNVSVGHSPNNSANGLHGYGILDNCSNFGRIIGGTFRHVRHAYTDDTPRVAPGAQLHGYGRTYGTLVLGARAIGTTAAAFDTHHDSEATHFLGCHVAGGVPYSSNAAGFQLRGKNHRVSMCSVDSMDIGLAVVNESQGGDSYGHIVEGLSITRATGTGIVVSVRGSSHPLARVRDGRTNVTIRNATVTESRRFFTAINSTARLSESSYTAPAGDVGGYYSGLRTTNSTLDLANIVLDYTLNSSGTPQPFNSVSVSGSTPGMQHTRMRDVEIRASPDSAARAHRPFHGSDHEVYGRRVVWNVPFPTMPGVLTAGSSLEWATDFAPGVARSDLNSAFTFMDASMLAGSLHWLSRSIDANQFVQTNPGGTHVQALEFPEGKVRGQTLTIWQQGVGTWTIRNGAGFRTALLGAADLTMQRNDQIRLVWDGVLWRQVA